MKKTVPVFCVLMLMICMASSAFAATSISGTVVDGNESPVQNATVTFTDESDSANQFTAVTTSDGTYEINMSTLVANSTPKAFSLQQNFPNPFNPSTTIPFSLDSSAHVTLSIYNALGQRVRTLVDSHYGAGQHAVVWDCRDDSGMTVGAGLYLYRLRSGNQVEARKMLLIDGGGSMSLSGTSSVSAPMANTGFAAKAASTIFTVSIVADGIETYEESGIVLQNGGVYDFVVTRLGFDISGTVTDTDGSPISGVSIELMFNQNYHHVVTGTDGAYTFENYSNGTYALSAELDGYAFSPVMNAAVIDNADVTDINFIGTEMTAGLIVSGYVIDSKGIGISGVKMWLASLGEMFEAYTDEKGRYDIPANTGTYTLQAMKDGYYFTPSSIEIEVTETVMLDTRIIGSTEQPTYDITTTLVDLTGKPVAFVMTTISKDGNTIATSTSDTNGTIVFSNIPDGTYTITPEEYTHTFEPKTVIIEGADLAIGEWEGTPLSEFIYSISGKVVDSEGNGVENARLRTSSTNGVITAYSDANGNFVLKGLADGMYAVVVDKEGWTFNPGSVIVYVTGTNATVDGDIVGTLQ